MRQGRADKSVCVRVVLTRVCASGRADKSVCVRVTLCKREMEGNACKLVSWGCYE